MSIIKNYYADEKKQTFYQKCWGGESIHVGIYLDDYKDNMEQQSLGDYIKNASKFKSTVMANLVKSYMVSNNLMYNGNGNKIKFKVADWGSGYGGTARTLSKLYGDTIDMSIFCYDLSDKNCEYNGKINNYEQYSNITIYNQSFLEITNPWFDIIYSEDAFVHINEKQKIFDQAYKNLNSQGHFIFSDIILKEGGECTQETLDEICRRINVETVGSKSLYLECAQNAGFTLANVIEYNDDIKKHYKYIRQFYLENEPKELRSDDIVSGLEDWIKHAEDENITMVIFIFKK